MTEIFLLQIQCIIGTEVMNYGVISDHLTHYKFVGISPNLDVLMQTMGRVDHHLDTSPGSNTFKICISFGSIVSMFICIMRATTIKECSTQLVAIFEVMRYLVTPNECYHSFIEHYFEIVHDSNTVDCGLFCKFCRRDIGGFTVCFHIQKLRSLPPNNFLKKGNMPHYKAFV